MSRWYPSTLAISAILLATTCAHAEAPSAAVFDFQLANLGAQGPTEADIARLGPLTDSLREQLRASGRYRIVSIEPVRNEVARSSDLRKCGGCADDFARKLGADVAITGEIQKVSNLILNINVYVKDLKSGTPEKAYTVDIRGDNDLSFQHGVKYLVKNSLPPSEASVESTKHGATGMVTVPDGASVVYQTGPANLPKGTQISMISGDPAKPGPFVLRLKFPANTLIAPHTHSQAETLTILGGSIYHQHGETIDKAAGKVLKAGGFVYLPQDMPHSLWTTNEPAELQVNGTGPFGLNYINPAGDPSHDARASR